MNPRFFKTPAAFRQWLAANHEKSAELWVGYYKKETGKASIAWPESVAEALCYGWIDGIRRKLDDESYVIRFTPRKPTSAWSTINMRNVERQSGVAGRQSADSVVALQNYPVANAPGTDFIGVYGKCRLVLGTITIID